MSTKAVFSSLLATLLIVGITVGEVGRLLFEVEDAFEYREADEEELREEGEGEKHWLRLLSHSDGGFLSADTFASSKRRVSFIVTKTHTMWDGTIETPPLYVLHCALKIHLPC